MTDEVPVRVRTAARVLLVDPLGWVLLLHGFDPHRPGTSYWYTVGGGIDDGETPTEAAVREVWEETGLRLEQSALVGPVHEDDVDFGFEGYRLRQHQWYFGALVERFDPQPADLQEDETRATLELAWVDPTVLRELGRAVYPRGLPALVAAVRSRA